MDMLKSRILELKHLFLAFLSLFVFIALCSHHNNDPSWSYLTLHHHFYNVEGALGAWLSDILLSFLGYSAYLIPLVLAYHAGTMFWGKNTPADNKDIWLHLAGYTLMVLSLASLLALALPNIGQLPMGSGGIVGTTIAWYCTLLAGIIGGSMVLVVLGLMGMYLLLHALDFAWLHPLPAKIKGLFGTLPKPSMPKPKLKMPVKEVASTKTSTPTNTDKTPRKVQTMRYQLPAISLLDYRRNQQKPSFDPEKIKQLTNDVNTKLLEFNIKGEVVDAHVGPVITRFEYQPDPGTKVSKITNIATDLARSLSVSSVRIVEVIPGKSTIGIELPNDKRCVVSLRDLIASNAFQSPSYTLPLALGKDISGHPQVADLAKMPHLLIAGTTGSGKSVGINGMILSLLYRFSPQDLRMIMIDPKMLELSIYEGIPHLLTPVVTNMNDAAHALNWCVNEMERRYQLMAALGVRSITRYNDKIKAAEKEGVPIMDPLYTPRAGDPAKPLTTMPYIVVVVDELADMMMVVGKKVEHLIVRIAQKARAAGIHLILATQRPSVNVLTGLIKSNMPTRIAFQVSSKMDSRIVLERGGAEALLGAGDMLYVPPGSNWPMRIHGAFVDDHEVHAVVKALKRFAPPDEGIKLQVNTDENDSGNDLLSQIQQGGENNDGGADALYKEAVGIVLSSKKASISYLQRRLKIGFNRAATLIETMEEKGVLSAPDEKGKRTILAAAPENTDA